MSAIKCPTCGHPDLAESECECTRLPAKDDERWPWPSPETRAELRIEHERIIAQREQIATNPPLTSNIPVNVKDGYLDLFTMLHRALNQAQNGKGNERHANGLPFNEQPIITIMQRHGFGFGFGQIDKKSDEAHGMIKRGEMDAAERELQGIIVYAAAIMLRIHQLQAEKEAN